MTAPTIGAAIVIVVMTIFKPIMILMMPPLKVAVNPAVLAARHAIIVGAVVPVFDAVVLPIVPVFDLMMVVMVSASVLRHRWRCEGQGGERAQGGEN